MSFRLFQFKIDDARRKTLRSFELEHWFMSPNFYNQKFIFFQGWTKKLLLFQFNEDFMDKSQKIQQKIEK